MSAVARDPAGKWRAGQSGNAAGRPPAMPVELKAMLCAGSADVAAKVLAAAIGGDMAAARLVLERIAPVSKTTTAPVLLPELENAQGLAGKSQAVINAIARGIVPPDVGSVLIQSLSSCARIAEITELAERIAALEAIEVAHD